MGFKVETIGKDVFFEKPFCAVIQRMGWVLTDAGDNWLVSYPVEDEPLFDFVFGV